MRLLAALALLVACRGGRVDDCTDSLAGVWRASTGAAPAGGPLRFHVLDHGAAIEIYPMFDTTAPPAPAGAEQAWNRAPTGDKWSSQVVYGPEVYDLARAGEGLRGTLGFRVSRDVVTCEVRWPAEIRSCRAGALVLAAQRGAARECGAPPVEWEERVLRRE